MKGVYQETKEAYIAQYKTTEGWFVILVGALIYGYLIVNYLDIIFSYLKSTISFLPNFLIYPVSFLLFGLFSAILDLVIIFVLSKIFKMLKIKNRKIF